jgi:hypothetical protein
LPQKRKDLLHDAKLRQVAGLLLELAVEESNASKGAENFYNNSMILGFESCSPKNSENKMGGRIG